MSGAGVFAFLLLRAELEVARSRGHVLAGERLHGDDTTVPRPARYKTDIALIWDYVQGDGPFAEPAPPAALYYYSRDREGGHPQSHLASWAGVLLVDRYAGFNKMFKAGWPGKLIIRANCWAHACMPVL